MMRQQFIDFLKWEDEEAVPLTNYLSMNNEQIVDMYLNSERGKEVLNLPVVMPRILDFKDEEGVHIDPDYVEMMYEDGEFKFYETDCHQKIKEVIPVYGA